MGREKERKKEVEEDDDKKEEQQSVTSHLFISSGTLSLFSPPDPSPLCYMKVCVFWSEQPCSCSEYAIQRRTVILVCSLMR